MWLKNVAVNRLERTRQKQPHYFYLPYHVEGQARETLRWSREHPTVWDTNLLSSFSVRPSLTEVRGLRAEVKTADVFCLYSYCISE